MPESPSPDELAARISVAEREIARLREELAVCSSDARAARTLASGADRDVSEVRAELRAHTRALSALRETQMEHGMAIDRLRAEMDAGFAEMRGGFAEMHDGFASVNEQLAEMRRGFATMATGMAGITTRLDRVIDQG